MRTITWCDVKHFSQSVCEEFKLYHVTAAEEIQFSPTLNWPTHLVSIFIALFILF